MILQLVVLLAKVAGKGRRIGLPGERDVRPCRGDAVQPVDWYLDQYCLACLAGIAGAILVAIALVGVGNAGTVVAGIADTITVRIVTLVGIVGKDAVVDRIRDAIVVGIAGRVVVRIVRAGIGEWDRCYLRAITVDILVTRIPNPVIVQITLARIVGIRTVVTRIADTIPITVELIRVIGVRAVVDLWGTGLRNECVEIVAFEPNNSFLFWIADEVMAFDIREPLSIKNFKMTDSNQTPVRLQKI